MSAVYSNARNGLAALATAFAMSCARPSPESAAVHPTEPDTSPRPTTTGCRFAERPLGPDERFGNWASPNEIATSMNREYRGHVEWRDVDGVPPDEITAVLEIDTDGFVIRYPISPAAPQERIICQSSLVVRFDVQLRLGDAAFTASTASVTFGAAISAQVPIPPEFAAQFAARYTDHYKVSLSAFLDGRSVGGRFWAPDDYGSRQAGGFGAR